MGRMNFLPGGQIGVAVHRRKTKKGEKTKKVPILGSVFCKTIIATVDIGNGMKVQRAVPHAKQPKTYRGNGKRETARRLRQMEKRA